MTNAGTGNTGMHNALALAAVLYTSVPSPPNLGKPRMDNPYGILENWMSLSCSTISGLIVNQGFFA